MSAATSFAPVSATAGASIQLAMQRLWLAGRVLPAGAHLTVQHVFRSAEDKPLEVIYSFPLPRDAALRAFRITGEGFEAHSELRPTEEAVKTYEQGIADGSLSTLARQYGDGVVNLTVGNIRPKETVTVYLELLSGVELQDDGLRFRFPFTLAPAYHAQMKAAVVAEGEGEMELPPDRFGDVVLPRFRKDASSLHEVGFELSILNQLEVGEIGSPSHSIRMRHDGPGSARVSLAPERDVPNRDLVLDVRFEEAAAQVLTGASAGEGKRTFAAVIPSTQFGVKPDSPRRTVIVLDRSGSMGGAPIKQARKAIEACLAALAGNDQFGIVAFDDKVESLSAALLSGSRENREKAREFLSQVDARGGTELAQGFLEASRMLNGGGDVLVLTDGQVAGTEQILAQARAAGIRLFCLGIGSASQDRFLSLLARETGGVSRFVTPRERVDMAAVDLFASIGRPVATGLKTAANVQPAAPDAVFAGSPVLLFGEAASGDDNLELTWDGGRLSLPLPAGSSEAGQTIWLLQGSRLITDWESRYPSDEALAKPDKRKESRVATRLLALSQTYGLASREMSLVAVVKREGDRPGELPETHVTPVGMPQDVGFEAYFAGKPAGVFQVGAPRPLRGAARFAAWLSLGSRPSPGSPGPADLRRRQEVFEQAPSPMAESVAEIDSPADVLLDLAAAIEPDGGVSGATISERVLRSVAALLAYGAEGHTLTAGAFRTHVTRLAAFLRSVQGLTDRERSMLDRAIQSVSAGNPPRGDWFTLARDRKLTWDRLEEALKTNRSQ